jgi:Tfp pilus assembly protein PilE
MNGPQYARGISLIEAVLGVLVATMVLAVVAGFYRQTLENQRSIETAELVLRLSETIQRSYAGAVNYTGLNQAAIWEQVPPEARYVSPSNAPMIMSRYGLVVVSASGDGYLIEARSLPRDSCARVLQHLSPHFERLFINGSQFQGLRFISATGANTACGLATNTNVIRAIGS